MKVLSSNSSYLNICVRLCRAKKCIYYLNLKKLYLFHTRNYDSNSYLSLVSKLFLSYGYIIISISYFNVCSNIFLKEYQILQIVFNHDHACDVPKKKTKLSLS